MARYDTTHKAETRQRILAHARQMVLTGGPDTLTIAPLMAALGLTHGGFYAHFASRERLLDAVIADLGRHAVEELNAAAAEPDVAAAAVERYIDRYLSTAHRDSTTWGCPLAYLSSDMPTLGAASRRSYADAYNSMLNAMTVLLQAAGEEAPDAVAQSFLAEMVGSLQMARALGRGKRSAVFLRVARCQLKKRLPAAPK